MTEASSGKGSIGQRFVKELREYLIISFYLWICFAALLIYKTAILQAEHVEFLPLGIATVKALILGKFILVGKAVKLGTRVKSSIVLNKIMWKSVAFLLLLLVFTAIEELVVGLIHSHSVTSIVSEFTARPWLESFAPAVVVLLVLIPMITFEEIDHALGEGKLRSTLFGRVNTEGAYTLSEKNPPSGQRP